MAVRICTIGVPRFQHDGLVVGAGWTPVDKDLPAPARATLQKQYGRFVRVHPDDIGKLSELGLQLKDGKLVDVKPNPGIPTTPPKTAPKGDGKKD